MKELVRHDLDTQLDAVDEIDQEVETLRLGREFCSTGVLHRNLLPWLWRNLRSVEQVKSFIESIAGGLELAEVIIPKWQDILRQGVTRDALVHILQDAAVSVNDPAIEKIVDFANRPWQDDAQIDFMADLLAQLGRYTSTGVAASTMAAASAFT